MKFILFYLSKYRRAVWNNFCYENEMYSLKTELDFVTKRDNVNGTAKLFEI